MIMRSKDRVDASGQKRALGFAFIEFINHKDALTALRSTNNNPEVFGPNRRPIVEFSIENSLALKAREQRLQRSKHKPNQPAEGQEKMLTNKERRQEKGIRRREKRQARKEKRKSGTEENKDNSISSQKNNTDGKKQQFPQAKTAPKKSYTAQNTRPNKNKFIQKNQPKTFDNKKGKQAKLGNRKAPEDQVNSDVNVNKRGNKRKANDLKEEKAFNSIVEKYKTKLFGDASSTAKRARWFE